MKKWISVGLVLLFILSFVEQGVGWSVLIQKANAAEAQVFDPKPAADALGRLVPQHADQVLLTPVDQGDNGDYFRISGKNEQLEISATSPAVLLTGFNWYLKYVAKANINWNGEQINLPTKLPLPNEDIVRNANVKHRFALNDTDDGYTGAYRSWQDWERMIDVLAINGMNEVLVTVGREAVYYDTFQEFGYTAQEMREWIPQPSHQPWWLLQNMCCFGGAITEELINERAALGKKIADRLRELGMEPVFPGYYGTVPMKFVEKNPSASIVPQGGWVGFTRPDWLDPRNEMFEEVAESFYRHQTIRFGTSSMYKMDLLHEGGSSGNVPVGEAAKKVEEALQAANPGAIWTILGWQSNPSAEMLAQLDKNKLLVLDGISDRYNNLNRERSWPDTPYAFGTIWNFGGHTTIGANLSTWNTRYWEWKNKSGNNLTGIAMMPEGGENNPAAFDFFAELAWQDGPVDLQEWFTLWSERRYGGSDEQANIAWQAIRQSAYDLKPGQWSEAQDGLFAAQPSLTAKYAATWSPDDLTYNTALFDKALPAMLGVSAELRESSAYKYDLMDITRQVLSNYSRTLLPQIKEAYDAKDQQSFASLTDRWLNLIKLMDEVVATNKQTMLGPWIERARAMASGDEERVNLEYDAKSILTIWGNRAGYNSGLRDYANREWAGLLNDYYYNRWEMYFDELKAALEANRQPNSIDWFNVGETWVRQQKDYPVEPTGDIYNIATKVMHELGKETTLGIKAAVDPIAVQPGGTAMLSATIINESSFATVKDIVVSILPNDVFTINATTSLEKERLEPGESFVIAFEAIVREPFIDGDLRQTLILEANYLAEEQVRNAESRIDLMIAETVKSPFRTASYNAAQFGQKGDSFGIFGGGQELWGATNEFGTIYLKNALKEGNTAITKVIHQDNTWGWARAGIIASNDLSVNNSAGFVNVAVTPDNGCVLSWDSNGDGQFDRFTNIQGVVTPTYVKLERLGNTFIGSCSVDGNIWSTAGSATLPHATDMQDVGLFMSAVNVVSEETGMAFFEGLNVVETTNPPETINLALGKPATASSSESTKPPSSGNDGSLSTMWIANGGDAGNWWEVDLGGMYELTSGAIHFEKQVQWKYKLETSVDRSSWNILVDRMDNSDTNQMQPFNLDGSGRYVRITFDQAPGQNWTSFQELQLYGGPIKEPEAPAAVISGSDSVQVGELYMTTIGLNQLSENIYALDMTIRYDANVFDYVSARPIGEGLSVLESAVIAPGTLRLILASLGANNPIIDNSEIVEVAIMTKPKLQSAETVIEVTNVGIANSQGNETTASDASLTVRVLAGIHGDVNLDGRVSIGDLGLAASYYGLTITSPNWQEARKADWNGDGVIDIADLTVIAVQIIQ